MKFFQMCIGRSLRLLVCTLVGIHGMASGQTDPVITAFGIVDGRVQLGMDGAAGEYKAQCSTSLGTGPWLPLTRLLSDGSSQQIEDVFDAEVAMKFYRFEMVPAADEFHLTGSFATALESVLVFADLQTTFGLNFPEGEAVLPPGNDLSFSSRNVRLYAAVIASLSKLAQDVSDSLAPGTVTPAEIAAALAQDIADGVLDGNDAGSPVQIGSSGFSLPAYVAQDFQDALAVVKEAIPGLYNVSFSEFVPAVVSQGEGLISVQSSGGSFLPTVPAVWGDFYWGSSDWQ